MRKESLLDWALFYASLGWFVFPLPPGKKTPYPGSHGFQDATDDIDTIKRWWTKSPRCNIGIDCGRSGLAVLDVDVKGEKVGAKSLMQLIGDNFDLLATLTVRTQSGGNHYIYSGSVKQSVGKLGKDLDIRGTGSYIVAVPSIVLEDGKTGTYSYTDGIDYIEDDNGEENPSFFISEFPKEFELNVPSPVKMCDELSVATGDRNNTLTSIAGMMRRKGLGYAEIYSTLRASNEARCRPMLKDYEVKRIAESVCRYAPSDVINELKKEQMTKPISGIRKLEVVRASEVKAEPVEWLWPGRIPCNAMTAIVGPEDAGKTYWYCWLAAQLSRGKALPGSDGPYDCESLIYHGEDLKTTVRSRLEKCDADLTKIHLISQTLTSSTIPDIDAYLAENTAIKLLVLDPISVILDGVSDNNDTEVRNVLIHVNTMAERRGVAVLFLRHTGKNTERTFKDRVLGAKAFIAYPRTVLGFCENSETGRRGIFTIKNNLSEKADPIEYFINDQGFFMGGEDDTFDADTFINSKTDPNKPKSRVKAEDVVTWLKQVLSEGPMLASTLISKGHANGFSEKSIRRNKETVGIQTEKSGMGGGWFWFMPKAAIPEDGQKSITPEKRASSEVLSSLDWSKNPVVTEGGQVGETGIFEGGHNSAWPSSKAANISKNPVVTEGGQNNYLRRDTNYDFSPDADNGVSNLMAYVDDVLGDYPREGEVAL